MTRIAKLALFSLAGVGFASSAQAVTVNIFLSRPAWEAAAGSFQEETFDDAILNPGIAWSSGVAAAISGGEFHDQVNSANAQPYTEWTFSPGIRAFGANWDLAGPGGPGTGLTITLMNGFTMTLATEISNLLDGDFFGFVSDTPFLSVRLTEGTQLSGVETYDMDNLVYSPVPEPGTLLLIGSGLTGLALRRRRKNRV